MSAPRIYWQGSPKFTSGHPAPLVALVHHRMVGTLRGTDATFADLDGRQASTHFGVGIDCGVTGHISTAHVHQYVRLGDQAWGNGNWDPSGAWDDRYPTTLINSRTISIEHHDNGNRKLGTGKGIVPEDVLLVSIELDRLLLRGDHDEMRDEGIRFRAGTEDAIGRELAAIPVDAHHVIDHHYISGRLKPSCWRPWADDPIGFPQSRYVAALTATEEPMSFKVPAKPLVAVIAQGGWIYDNALCATSAGNMQISPGPRKMPVAGKLPTGVLVIGYVDSTPTEGELPAYYAKAGNPTEAVATAPVQVPPDAVACKPFIDAAVTQAEKVALEAVKVATAAATVKERDRIAAAEGARIRGL